MRKKNTAGCSFSHKAWSLSNRVQQWNFSKNCICKILFSSCLHTFYSNLTKLLTKNYSLMEVQMHSIRISLVLKKQQWTQEIHTLMRQSWFVILLFMAWILSNLSLFQSHLSAAHYVGGSVKSSKPLHDLQVLHHCKALDWIYTNQCTSATQMHLFLK